MNYLASMQDSLTSFTSVLRWVLAIGFGLVVVALAARLSPRWPALVVGVLVGACAYAMSSQFV